MTVVNFTYRSGRKMAEKKRKCQSDGLWDIAVTTNGDRLVKASSYSFRQTRCCKDSVLPLPGVERNFYL